MMRFRILQSNNFAILILFIDVFSSVTEGKPTMVIQELDATEFDKVTRYLKISSTVAENYTSEQITQNVIDLPVNIEIIPVCKVATREISCTNGDIKFMFYTSKNQRGLEISTSSPLSIKEAAFIQGRPIKVILHGYNQTMNSSSIEALQLEFLNNTQGMNVISVDYYNLASNGCYVQGIQNSPVVAECVAQLVDAIVSSRNDISMKQFHFLGFSLGGQVCGQISNFRKCPETYSRITGLDPAIQGFYGPFSTPQWILDPNDADLVDIIHSDTGVLGQILPFGDVDFFVNSGVFQRGCPANTITCSHVRSLLVYVESINEKIIIEANQCPFIETFYISGCENKTHITFGENLDLNTRGIYFFETNGRSPYIGTVKLDKYAIFQSQEQLADLAEQQGLL